MKRSYLSLLSILLAACFAFAAPKAVVWTSEIEKVSDSEGILKVKADIASEYHIYGMTMPEIPDMPTYPTTITIAPAPGLVLEGEISPSVPASEHFDELMSLSLPWWSGSVTFSQKFKLDGVKWFSAQGHYLLYGLHLHFLHSPHCGGVLSGFRKGGPSAAPAAETAPAVAPAVAPASSASVNSLWDPVDSEYSSTLVPESTSLLSIFIMGFLGGLVALLTPCVWPMIPMTVSFFLKTSKDRHKAVFNAVIYGVSIVAIFLASVLPSLPFSERASSTTWPHRLCST